MADEREERLVAHALVIGALKGAVTGLIPVFPIAYVAVASPSAPSWTDVATGISGTVLAASCLCGLDAASKRLASRSLATACRFAAGFFTPLALLAPQAGLLELTKTSGLALGEAPLLLAAFGVGLGASLVAAGSAENEAHEPQGCDRILLLALVAPAISALVVSAVAPPRGSDVFSMALLGTIVAMLGSLVLWIGQFVGGLMARRLALRLEPEVVRVADVRALGPRGLELVAERLHEAARSPERSRHIYVEALAALERLEPELPHLVDRIDQGAFARRRAEALLALGRLAEAERLAGTVAQAPALRAELARRRGDPEAAVAIAKRWLEDLERWRSTRAFVLGVALDEPVTVKNERASAHALVALARADQGRIDEARAEVEASRALPEWYPRAFEYLGIRAVARYVEDRAGV